MCGKTLLYAVMLYLHFRSILHHLKIILELSPELVFTVQTDLLQFISVLDNSQKFPQLYMHLVWVVGEYTSPNYR